MRIENLKQNKCPKCANELNWDKEEELLKCECGFSLTADEFTMYMDEILLKDRVPDVDDNLRGLNNL